MVGLETVRYAYEDFSGDVVGCVVGVWGWVRGRGLCGFEGGEGEGVESVDFGDMVLFGRFVVGIFVVHW